MPPNRHRRKKAKKSGLHDTNGVADDDAFEVDDKPIKKRYKASSATRQNLRSSDKSSDTNTVDKKHVDVKQKKSSSPEMKNKLPTTTQTDSDQSDIEMDIETSSQKHNTRSKDTETGEQDAKRQKLCDESPNVKEVVSEPATPTVSDEPTGERDSNAKTSEDNIGSSERILDNDSDDLDYELAIDDTELLLDLDANEASGSGTKSAESTATEKEIETNAVIENEAEGQNEVESHTEDADSENAAIDKELNEGCEDDVADDDVVSLYPEDDDDMFRDDDDVSKSPLVTRKKNLMNIPRWKKAEMEKGKGTETNEPKKSGSENANRPTVVNRVSTTTVTSIRAPIKGPTTTTTPKAAASTSATVQKLDTVFKIPQVQKATNRDPRLGKTITNNNIAATNTAQATQPSNQSTSLTNANAGERKSVKERLGIPGQGLFSNIKNTTSYVIQSNMRLTAEESASVANRVDQQIPSIPMSMVKYGSENANQQNVMQSPLLPPVVRPTPPAFARKSMDQADTELILPSFATGAQKYEPVFTHLFKRTCRNFIRDSCIKPDCQMEHRMPDHELFRNEIDKMFQTSIIDLYENYMCRNQKLFDFYFVVFCQYFGKNKLIENLKQMAEDCVERKVPFHFIHIIKGLMLTGQTFAKALATLIPSIPCRSMKTSKEIIKLVLDQRIENIDPFVSVIDSIRQNKQFKFSNEWINRLLIIHSQKKKASAALNNTIFELINGVSVEKSAKALDQELMTKFIDSFTKSQQGLNES